MSTEKSQAETVNYCTYKPERDGLFCERIFGPSKDYECIAVNTNASVTEALRDRCGVEVTERKYAGSVGHISLVVPVAHLVFRPTPNKIGYLLGIRKKLESIIYRSGCCYPAGDPEADGIQPLDFFTEEEYLNIWTLPKETKCWTTSLINSLLIWEQKPSTSFW